MAGLLFLPAGPGGAFIPMLIGASVPVLGAPVKEKVIGFQFGSAVPAPAMKAAPLPRVGFGAH